MSDESPTGLVRYDAMCRAIAEAHQVDEVKEIRNQAIALEAYSRQAMNLAAEKRAKDIRLRAERKSGDLLKEMLRNGVRAKRGGDRWANWNDSSLKTLKDLKITYDQSADWQKLAEVPEEMFEEELAGENPSTAGIIARHEAALNQAEILEGAVTGPPVSSEAIWVCGRLRDFRSDVLARDPSSVLQTMLPHMIEQIKRDARPTGEWLMRLAEAADEKGS